MESEIREQPARLEELIRTELPRLWKSPLRRPRMVMFAGRGTSDNAAHYGKYLFETKNGIPTALAAPSVFGVYGAKLDLRDVLVIGISQSGQAADVIEVLRRSADMGATTLAVTNVPDSPLAQAAQEVIPCHAGPELAVAATKTYTTSLAALLLLSAAFSQDEGMRREIESLPQMIEQGLTGENLIRSHVERFRYLEQCVVLGRGYNLATALELGLKLRETCYIEAQPFAAPDFLHGPIAVVEKGYPILAIAPPGKVLPSLLQVLDQVKERGGEAVIFGDSPEALERADVGIPIGGSQLPEYLSPFPAIVAGQIFAHSLAMVRGLDPDAPRGLRKVTITR